MTHQCRAFPSSLGLGKLERTRGIGASAVSYKIGDDAMQLQRCNMIETHYSGARTEVIGSYSRIV